MCDYYIQNNLKIVLNLKTEEDEIFINLMRMLWATCEDDLKNAIYSEEYQFDLAFELINFGRFAVLMLLNWESGVGFCRKVFSQKLQKFTRFRHCRRVQKNASRIFNDLTMDLKFSTSVGMLNLCLF